MQSIYQDIILDHYRSPRNFGRLTRPTVSKKVINTLCGDEIEMDIIIKNNKVTDISFSGKGCAISTASASLVTTYAKGKTRERLLKLNKEFIMKLLGIKFGPNRIKCALLPLEALQDALNKTH